MRGRRSPCVHAWRGAEETSQARTSLPPGFSSGFFLQLLAVQTHCHYCIPVFIFPPTTMPCTLPIPPPILLRGSYFVAEKEQTETGKGVNWPLNKHIVSISFSSPVSRLSCPEKHFRGVLSLLTPKAPELLPKLNGFSFHASAKSLLLPAQPISSQATQKQLQQQKASMVIITLPCNAPAGCALGQAGGFGWLEILAEAQPGEVAAVASTIQAPAAAGAPGVHRRGWASGAGSCGKHRITPRVFPKATFGVVIATALLGMTSTAAAGTMLPARELLLLSRGA